VGTLHGCVGSFPGKKGGEQVLAGPAQYRLTIRSLLRNPLVTKTGQKKLTKFGKFTLMEKWTQLLLIEWIWQSQKFDKPSYNQLMVNLNTQENV
jgi:hypothetical protein